MHHDRFSVWTPWLERSQIAGTRWPGIYALAISRESLAGRSFTYLREIVYFGMTNSVSGLNGRLQQFDNTIHGKTGHGGADRFRQDFPRAEQLEPILFVAVMSLECTVTANTPNDLLTMGRVAMAEYECFAHYVQLHGTLPKYNDKKNAPKRAREDGDA